MRENHRSHHAQARKQQRGITESAVSAVRQYGRRIRQPEGRVAYFLGRKEVISSRAHGLRLDDFVNHAVIVSADGMDVTFIKTPDVHRLKRWGRPRRRRRDRGCA